MLVSEMTAVQLYSVVMLAFVIVMMAGQGLKVIPSLTRRQQVVAWFGMFVTVGGPALWGLMAL